MGTSSFVSEVFSPRCAACRNEAAPGSYLCASCEAGLFPYEASCDTCGHPSLVPVRRCEYCSAKREFHRMFVRYPYRSRASDVIKRVKYDYGIRGIDAIRELVGDLSMIDGYDAVVAVPSHPLRRLLRFVHPADIIASTISERTGIPAMSLLKRTKRTKKQAHLGRRLRRKNVKGAFRFSSVSGFCPLKILLVDDILSTGATVNECARTLKMAGAERIDLFALTKGAYRP